MLRVKEECTAQVKWFTSHRRLFITSHPLRTTPIYRSFFCKGWTTVDCEWEKVNMTRTNVIYVPWNLLQLCICMCNLLIILTSNWRPVLVILCSPLCTTFFFDQCRIDTLTLCYFDAVRKYTICFSSVGAVNNCGSHYLELRLRRRYAGTVFLVLVLVF